MMMSFSQCRRCELSKLEPPLARLIFNACHESGAEADFRTGLTLKPSFLGMASPIPYSHGSSCNAKAWRWLITAGIFDKRNGVQRHFARQ